VAPGLRPLFSRVRLYRTLQRKTGNQIGLEGLPLIFNASLLPGIHKILTWSPL
jgi:hypothetical protein